MCAPRPFDCACLVEIEPSPMNSISERTLLTAWQQLMELVIGKLQLLRQAVGSPLDAFFPAVCCECEKRSHQRLKIGNCHTVVPKRSVEVHRTLASVRFAMQISKRVDYDPRRVSFRRGSGASRE